MGNASAETGHENDHDQHVQRVDDSVGSAPVLKGLPDFALTLKNESRHGAVEILRHAAASEHGEIQLADFISGISSPDFILLFNDRLFNDRRQSVKLTVSFKDVPVYRGHGTAEPAL